MANRSQASSMVVFSLGQLFQEHTFKKIRTHFVINYVNSINYVKSRDNSNTNRLAKVDYM